MVFHDILRRDYEVFENRRQMIYLPVKYFLRRIRGFFIWYLIAGLTAYHFAVVNSLFVWAYATFTLIEFVRIWELFRLSKAKLIVLMAILWALGLIAGTLLRNLIGAVILML